MIIGKSYHAERDKGRPLSAILNQPRQRRKKIVRIESSSSNVSYTSTATSESTSEASSSSSDEEDEETSEEEDEERLKSCFDVFREEEDFECCSCCVRTSSSVNGVANNDKPLPKLPPDPGGGVGLHEGSRPCCFSRLLFRYRAEKSRFCDLVEFRENGNKSLYVQGYS